MSLLIKSVIRDKNLAQTYGRDQRTLIQSRVTRSTAYAGYYEAIVEEFGGQKTNNRDGVGVLLSKGI